MRDQTKRWIGRAVAVVMVTAALGFLPYHLYARSGLVRTLALRRDLRSLQARNADLRATTDVLAREAEALRSDPEAIEQVARDELGWVREGEIVLDLGASPASGPVGRSP